MLVLIVVGVAGTLTDAYTLLEARNRAYRAAADAVLAGASAGRDWAGYVATGEMSLAESVARDEAESILSLASSNGSLPGYQAQIEVLPDPHGGTIPGFPPDARAHPFGATDWTSDEPSVGVYVTVQVPTVFLGLFTGGGTVTLHVFAAAGVAGVSP